MPLVSLIASRRPGAARDALDLALVQRARTAGPDERTGALRDAVEGLLPMASALARRYHRGEEPLEDLEQVAAIGLLKAIRGFDLERGTPFGAYAVPTIVGELRRHYRDRGWTIRVPRDLQELSTKLTGTTDALSVSLGRAPTAAELAERLETTVERIVETRHLATAMRPVSLDRPLAPEPGAVGEALIDHLGGEDRGYEAAEEAFTAHRLLKRLPERERKLLELRFREELTQTEIAARLGISQMQVSRLLRRSLARLAEPEAAW